jgi:hypothetical protein
MKLYGYDAWVYKALFLQITKGTKAAAMYLWRRGFEVDEAVAILASRPKLRG